MTRCRSCQADIRWATTVRRKAMPLDPAPTDYGNVDLQWIDAEEIAVVLGPLEAQLARDAGRPLYASHHMTCPQGASWRKANPRTDGGQPENGERRSDA